MAYERVARKSGVKLELEELKEIAAARGGDFVSDEYKGSRQNHRWQCAHGHEWLASPNNIISHGSWCPHCRETTPETILNKARAYAASKGGLCLSEQFINSQTPMRWRCSNGHEWNRTWNGISSKQSWCARCARSKDKTNSQKDTPASKSIISGKPSKRRRITIPILKEMAKSMGGECLSETYRDQRTPLLWKCHYGHLWRAAPNNVLYNNSWCPQCIGKISPTIDQVKEWATRLGGECLSSEFVTNNHPLEWRCSDGHEWTASFDNIKHGKTWCPHCRKKGENIARDVLEKITGYKFPSTRPKWLRGCKGRLLELDGFCEELGIAFEYQGLQHYGFNSHFHQTQSRFDDQVKRDAFKRSVCISRSIFLIEIPEIKKPTIDNVHTEISRLCNASCLPIMTNPEFAEHESLATKASIPLHSQSA